MALDENTSLVVIYLQECSSDGTPHFNSANKPVLVPILVPEPREYSGTTSTVVDSTRNAKAVLIGSIVRDDMAKVSMSWNYLKVNEYSLLLRCFKQNTIINLGNDNYCLGNFMPMVKFFDLTSGEYVTRQMYPGDRTSKMWRRNPSTLEVMGWTDCKFNLIEV